jgi:hypothetical protein
MPKAPLHRQQKHKNLALALGLIALMAAMLAISIIRMGQG